MEYVYKKPSSNQFNPGDVMLFNLVTKTMCPLQGFKCPDDDHCDCRELCTNGLDYTRFQILANESVFVMDRILKPGVYCLPKGIEKCNYETTIPFLSLTGWACVPRNSSFFNKNESIACKSDDARDNSKNVLWDYRLGKEARNIKDFYEKENDGQYRYRCKCESQSMDGTRMISPIPFVCVTDYCLRDIKNPNKASGWNGQSCKCTTYPHLVENDETSPCMSEVTRLKNGMLNGRVDCMTETSYVRRAFLCPSDDNVMHFKVPVGAGNLTPVEFVRTIINPEELQGRNEEIIQYYGLK